MSPDAAQNVHGLTTLEKMKWLRNAIIFANCKTDQLLALASISEEVTYRPGEVIFRENEPGDSLLYLIKGRVRLRKEGTQYESIVGEGETVGTLSILDGQPRAATGLAEDEVVGLKIKAEDFYELLSDNVEIVQGIFSRLTQEIRSYRYRQSSL